MSRVLDAAERQDCLDAIARTLAWGTQKPTDRERANAEHLVSVISQIRETWSGGPAPRIWARSLAARNPDTVLDAVKRLTETATSCPTVAQLMAVCRQIDREAIAAGRDPLPDCDKCENTGWVEVLGGEVHGFQRIVHPGRAAHREWDGEQYVDVPAVPDRVEEVPNVNSAVRPCGNCLRGRAVERSDAWKNRKRDDLVAAAAQEQF